MFIPIGALIATALLWYFFRKKLSVIQIYIFSLLGYATAGIADTFTSYGTKLFWPFLDTRYSWDLISVFDPIFSIIILTCGLLTYFKINPKYSWGALGWIAFYLLFASIQQQRGQKLAQSIAKQNNHQIERLVVKPTLANQLLWSIRYEEGDSLYAYGARLSMLTSPTIYSGSTAPLLDWQEEFADFKGTTLYDDIRRFNKLSEGYLIAHPRHANVIGDGRYAMLPTAMDPLWGIKIDTTQPQQHLPFQTFRDPNPVVRSTYIDMLLGR